MTAALEKWADMYSDLPLFAGSEEDGSGGRHSSLANFQTRMAYHVTVSRAVVVKSDYSGDVQVEADYTAPGFKPKKVWYTLPMQESDLNREKTKVLWMTQKRMRDISVLYAAAIPSVYALYDTVHDNGTHRAYQGMDGEPMDSAAFARRRKSIEEAITQTVKDLHGRLGQPVRELQGASMYMVVIPNEKHPKYPFVNLYRHGQKPKDIPVWVPDEDAPAAQGGAVDEDNIPF